MQTTANDHHQVAHAVFPDPYRIFDNPTVFDVADDMLDQNAPFGALLVSCLLLGGQFALLIEAV